MSNNSNKKRINEFFLKPPIWFDVAVWTLTVVAVAAAIYVACLDHRAEAWAFLLYAAAVLAFVSSLYLFLSFGDIPQRLARNKYVKRFVADFGFRSYVTSVCSAILNITYVVFGTVIAVHSRSIWLGALVLYNLVLASCRAIVFFYVKRRIKDADHVNVRIKSYIFSGVMLIVIALAIIPVILLVIWHRNRYIFFGGTIVYVCALALYTMIKLITAIVGRHRARKHGGFLVRAIRNFSLASSLVSIFALQATLFVALGDEWLATILNPIVGGVIAFVIAVMGITMTVKGAIVLKRNNYDGDDDDEDVSPDRVYIV
ncbi:MAG: hypothetical protein J1G04_03115 [Clostridiales bacterium]|nr:hypothetical protein [Clostridiales bacterium]